jgi:hypothetical protein
MLSRRFFLSAVLTAGLLSAQGPTASVTGQVKDPSGAALTTARVVARNTATNSERIANTDSSGLYLIGGLQPGSYEVLVEADGFKRAVRAGLVLQIDQEARIDLVLEIGNVSEAVTVTEATPVTATESASTGQVIENRKVVELPLNSREFYGLALLAPGAFQPAQNSTLGFRGGFNVAGSSETANNFSVNGIDNNDTGINGPSFRPSVDSIQEFKLLTGIFPAEYGRSSGSQVVVITKSGSNRFHGGLFEFLRNQKLDAKNFFTPVGVEPAYRRNQFGGTAGGPIQHDRTFFFYSYEGLRLRQQISSLGTVPLAPWLSGDFSSLLALTKPVQLLNPLTKAPVSGNQIPASQISPLGKQLASYYPKPNLPGDPKLLPAANYNFSEIRRETMNENSLRIDHLISAKDQFFGNYNRFYDPSFEPQNSLCGSSTLPLFGCDSAIGAQLGALAETHSFTPGLVNEFRAGINRLVQPRVQEDNSLGFPGLAGVFVTPLLNNKGLPRTTVTGFSALGGATNLPSERDDTTYQVIDNLSWVKGRHGLKFGYEWHKFFSTNLQVNNGRGTLSFTGSAPGPTSGNTIADMIYGYATTSGRNPFAPWFYNRVMSTSLFVQDDYKVNPSLTLNIGLRWEYHAPITEKYGQMSSFDLSVPGGGLRVMNQNGVPNSLTDPNYKNFAPRFGFAWQPFHAATTVVRSGFGIFYNQPTTLNGFYNLALNAPFRNPQTFNATVANPVQLDTNPFPNALAVGANTATGINQHYPNALAQQWSLGVQRQVGKDILVELTYLGSKGTHLPSSLNPNQPRPGSANPVRSYVNFGNITWFQDNANAEYHALLAKADKRLSNGLSFLVSWTYGKSIDEASGPASASDASGNTPQDSQNQFGSNRGRSDFDVKSRLVVSPIWELPFGKGQGPFNYAIRGWQVSSIFSLQTGRPFTAGESGNISLSLQNSDRPNVVPGCNPNDGPKTVDKWFKTECFTLPVAAFGNAGRNIITGPGLVNIDFSIARNFAIREFARLQFRAEAFNSVNHPNFNYPSATQNTATFGHIASAQDPRQIQLGMKLVF